MGEAEKSNNLYVAKKQLSSQNEEQAAALVAANKELAFQNEEKAKRAAELLIANKELVFQNELKDKRAAELLIANKELAFQNQEKERRASELITSNKELKEMLKKLMFITSHKIRQPVGHILGISNLIDDKLIKSPDDLLKMVAYIKESVLSLDNLTRELTIFIQEQEIKLEKKEIENRG